MVKEENKIIELWLKSRIKEKEIIEIFKSDNNELVVSGILLDYDKIASGYFLKENHEIIVYDYLLSMENVTEFSLPRSIKTNEFYNIADYLIDKHAMNKEEKENAKTLLLDIQDITIKSDESIRDILFMYQPEIHILSLPKNEFQ